MTFYAMSKIVGNIFCQKRPLLTSKTKMNVGRGIDWQKLKPPDPISSVLHLSVNEIGQKGGHVICSKKSYNKKMSIKIKV